MTDFGQWLKEASIPLRRVYILNDQTDEIVEEVYDDLRLSVSNKHSTQVRRFKALKCILGNLLLGGLYDNPVRYSRNANNFPPAFYSPEWHTYRIVVPVLNGLRDRAWITEKKGFWDQDRDRGFETRGYANQKLREFFDENLLTLINNLVYVPIPNREIVLRDGEHKEIPFEETDETKQWRYDIQDYNSSIPPVLVHVENLPEKLKEKYINRVLSLGRGTFVPSHSLFQLRNTILTQDGPLLKDMFSLYIENCDETRLSLSTLKLLLTNNDSPILLKQEQVYRVFNGSWRTGGRFFGPTYQGFSEEVRNCIYVDGEPTVEKDYSGMQLGMALNKAGVPHTQDPYYRITHGNPELKKFYKLVGNAALCSSDLNGHKGRSRAIWGLTRKVKKGKLKMPVGLKTNTAIDKFVKAYPEIEGMFFQGFGLELQFIESKIMNRIIKRLLGKGIFPLIIHDSVRVQERHVGDLEQVMEEEYEKVMFEHTGRRFKPVIK